MNTQGNTPTSNTIDTSKQLNRSKTIPRIQKYQRNTNQKANYKSRHILHKTAQIVPWVSNKATKPSSHATTYEMIAINPHKHNEEVHYHLKADSYCNLGPHLCSVDVLQQESFHQDFFAKYGQTIAPFCNLGLKQSKHQDVMTENVDITTKQEEMDPPAHQIWQDSNNMVQIYMRQHGYKQPTENIKNETAETEQDSDRDAHRNSHCIDNIVYHPRLRDNEPFFAKRRKNIAEERAKQTFFINNINAVVPTNNLSKFQNARKILKEEVMDDEMHQTSDVNENVKQTKTIEQQLKDKEREIWLFKTELKWTRSKQFLYQDKKKQEIRYWSKKIKQAMQEMQKIKRGL
eukprot:193792_1